MAQEAKESACNSTRISIKMKSCSRFFLKLYRNIELQIELQTFSFASRAMGWLAGWLAGRLLAGWLLAGWLAAGWLLAADWLAAGWLAAGWLAAAWLLPGWLLAA